MGKLTVVKVKSLNDPGRYGDGDGLWLQVRGAEQKSWLLRYTAGGKPRQMGLGDVDVVTLAEARDAALEARRMLAKGVDPIEHRQSVRAAAKAVVVTVPTFSEVAGQYIKAHEAGWRNEKHRAQWTSTLKTYAEPVLGKLRVSEVDTAAVTKVLQPIWHVTPETASRLRGRIEAVLDFAAVRSWRTGENPARWKGHLAKVLPIPSKLERGKVEHHAALHWREIGAFMEKLRAQPGSAALALEFAIFTAARTGEVIGATWGELDFAEAAWTVPGKRMKAGREHRVPLSAPALAVLQRAAQEQGSERGKPTAPVFPGRKGKPLSNMAMLALMRRMGRDDLTAHGFRSTFRDWVAEATTFQREVAEAALAHALKDKVEAAYQRGTLFDKRRELMDAWATWCGKPSAEHIGNVVQIRSDAAA